MCPSFWLARGRTTTHPLTHARMRTHTHAHAWVFVLYTFFVAACSSTQLRPVARPCLCAQAEGQGEQLQACAREHPGPYERKRHHSTLAQGHLSRCARMTLCMCVTCVCLCVRLCILVCAPAHVHVQACFYVHVFAQACTPAYVRVAIVFICGCCKSTRALVRCPLAASRCMFACLAKSAPPLMGWRWPGDGLLRATPAS